MLARLRFLSTANTNQSCLWRNTFDQRGMEDPTTSNRDGWAATTLVTASGPRVLKMAETPARSARISTAADVTVPVKAGVHALEPRRS
jgi:hypothetical protein